MEVVIVPNRREEAVSLIRAKAIEHRETPFQLASGELSHDYIDGKHAISNGRDLELVCKAILSLLNEEFDAVGGLTMGADALAHAIALLRNTAWFSVRKGPKAHGRQAFIEGARLKSGDSVLLVDDVVSTGGSIRTALERVVETGASVVAVVAMVDRGDATDKYFTDNGIPYHALATYRDLGINPVGHGSA